MSKDITGQQFGRFKIIEHSHYHKYDFYKVQCKCNFISIKRIDYIKSKVNKTEGMCCKKLENIIEEFNDNTFIINLTHNQKTLINKADYEMIRHYTWIAMFRPSYRNGGEWTASANHTAKGVKRCVYMHRLIIGAVGRDQEVDHIDGNPLNNRRENLRIVTKRENAMNRLENKANTSGFRGVSWMKQINKWRATIVIMNKQLHLGTFAEFEDAANARKEAELKYFGEYSPLNKHK